CRIGRIHDDALCHATAAVLLGCASAYAQARMNVSPLPALGMTSPLGMPEVVGLTPGVVSSVAPSGIPVCPIPYGATCAGAAPAPAGMGSSTTAASTGMGTPMTGAA